MAKVLTRREKGIFFTTVAVVVFSLIFHFLIAPVINDNDILNKEISVAQSKLSKYLRLLSQKDNIEKAYNQFSSALNIKDAQDDKQVEILTELERLAKEANIRIIDIRPSLNVFSGSSAYKETLVDFRAEGNMTGFTKFIYEVENSLSLLQIKKLQLTTRSNLQGLEGSFSISQLSLSKK